MIQIPVSVGELIDKLSILHVKKTKVSNEQKLTFINTEFELLYNMSSYYLNDEEISKLYHKLVEINSKLWDVEDELRVIESTKEFDVNFIGLSRKVYYTNDERFSVKNKINELTNSDIREQKDYKNY
jgi:nuclear transport factor 2 (NTF2) superfamily protein